MILLHEWLRTLSESLIEANIVESSPRSKREALVSITTAGGGGGLLSFNKYPDRRFNDVDEARLSTDTAG